MSLFRFRFNNEKRLSLELKKYQKANDCGLKSLKAAEEFEDEVWQLNASVLVAQAQGISSIF